MLILQSQNHNLLELLRNYIHLGWSKMSIHLSARRGEFAVLSVQQISGVSRDAYVPINNNYAIIGNVLSLMVLNQDSNLKVMNVRSGHRRHPRIFMACHGSSRDQQAQYTQLAVSTSDVGLVLQLIEIPLLPTKHRIGVSTMGGIKNKSLVSLKRLVQSLSRQCYLIKSI